jgi:hypothetical protein
MNSPISESVSTKMLFMFCAALLLLPSCSNPDANQTASVIDENNFSGSLTEKQIGTGNYYIAIPTDYVIRETEGPDFFVYYIAPADTNAKRNFYGGIYFGNHPNNFEADNDSCKNESLTGQLLGDKVEWTTYNCQGDYTIQTIIDNKSGEEWNGKIHAFGGAVSKNELSKVLAIFATLKRK